MNLPDWLKVFELKPRFFFAIWTVGSLFLFLSIQAKDVLGITKFVDTYRGVIGAVTVVTFVLWIVQLELWEPFFASINERRFKKEFSSKIAELSDDERLLLAYCLSRKKQTIHLSAMHAVATSLRAKGFLNYVGGIIYTSAMPFNVPSFIWKELISRKYELFTKEDWDNPQAEEIFQTIDRQMSKNERVTYR